MKVMALFSVAALLTATSLCAQSGQKVNAPESSEKNVTKTLKKPVNLEGQVGNEGRTFTADADRRIWQVSNPDTLRGIYGRHVLVRARLDATNNGIQVLTVKAVGEEHTWVKLDDAAFRR